jgi:hypothetical protein
MHIETDILLAGVHDSQYSATAGSADTYQRLFSLLYAVTVSYFIPRILLSLLA